MKSKRSSLVCITLAFILLFLGMCSQRKWADSFLANFQNVAETATIEKAEIDSSYIGKCTDKLITGLRDTFQNIRRGQGKIALKSHVEFLCMEEILQIFLSFYFVMAVVCYQIQGSKTTILNYIHNQDGEK